MPRSSNTTDKQPTKSKTTGSRLPVCDKKLKYINFIDIYNKSVPKLNNSQSGGNSDSDNTPTDDLLSKNYNQFNSKYFDNNDNYIGDLDSLNKYFNENKIILNKFVKSDISNVIFSTNNDYQTIPLNDNSKNLLKLETIIDAKLKRMNKKDGHKIIKIIISIIVAGIGIWGVWNGIKWLKSRSDASVDTAELVQASAPQPVEAPLPVQAPLLAQKPLSPGLASLATTKLAIGGSKRDPVYGFKTKFKTDTIKDLLISNNIKILKEHEAFRAVPASALAVFIVGIITYIYTEIAGGTAFQNMLWVQMIFGNLLGFICDQIISKHEGLLLFFRGAQSVKYNPSPSTGDSPYTFTWPTQASGADPASTTVASAEATLIPLTRMNYLAHKIVSKQFIRFLITVLIDICASSYLTIIATKWAREYNMFPKCYTSTLCGDPNNLTDDEDKNKKKKAGFDTMFVLAMNTIIGLITFYLYVNKTRMGWAYVTDNNINPQMNFSIIMFAIVASAIYMNQSSIDNPTLFQKIHGKRILCIVLFLLLLFNEYVNIPKLNNGINRSFTNPKFNIVFILIPIMVLAFPLVIGFSRISKKKSTTNSMAEAKCHSDIYKMVRQYQSGLTHFHDNDNIDPDNDKIRPDNDNIDEEVN